MARCPDCNSSSDAFGLFGDGKCGVCGGDGKDHHIIGELAKGVLGGELRDCWNCGGSGTCPKCNGTGEVEDQ